MIMALHLASMAVHGEATLARQREIIRFLEPSLRDAPSARWKWPAQKDPTTYCGWVNAKNGYGGYAGWQPFYIVWINGHPTGGIAKSDHDAMIETFCGWAGYDYVTPPR